MAAGVIFSATVYLQVNRTVGFANIIKYKMSIKYLILNSVDFVLFIRSNSIGISLA